AAASSKGRTAFAAWLRERVPSGGEVIDEPGAPLSIVHTVRARETYLTVAASYVDLTLVYTARELAKAIRLANHRTTEHPAQPGDRLIIPALVEEPFRSADDERLGWPEDKVLRGLYIRGGTAGSAAYVAILDRMAERGI